MVICVGRALLDDAHAAANDSATASSNDSAALALGRIQARRGIVTSLHTPTPTPLLIRAQSSGLSHPDSVMQARLSGLSHTAQSHGLSHMGSVIWAWSYGLGHTS